MILKWKVLADVGNYIWGRGMAELGFELCDARIGAHVHNAICGKARQINTYDFGVHRMVVKSEDKKGSVQ